MSDDPEREAQEIGEEMLESLAGVIAVGTLGLGVTAAVLNFGSLTPVIFIVGWLLLLPLAGVLSDNSAAQAFVGRLFDGETGERERAPVGDDEAALEELKRRYARGEIDEMEFERRTATLLENESVDDVRDRVDRSRDVREDRDVPRDDPGDDADVVDAEDRRESEGRREREDRREREREYET